MSAQRARLPLTAAQSWVWYAQNADPDNPVYKAAEYIDIDGSIDLSLLRSAVRQAVEDTGALRARFGADEDGTPWQEVVDQLSWPFPVVDLRQAADPWTAAREWMSTDLERPMDLTSAPLFSFAVLRISEQRSLVYFGVHHVLLDGYGLALFLQRVAEVYSALEQDQQVPPSTLGTLAQLVEDDLQYQRSERFVQDRQFWMEQLAGVTEIVTPAGDRPAATARSFLRETETVPGPVADRLRALARRARSSLPTVAMAAFGLYVHRVTRADDLLLELVVSGRQGPVARGVPGMLTSAPPLRVQMHPGITVGELLRETAVRARGVLQHQRYPSMYLPADLGLAGIGDVPEPAAINIMGYSGNLHFGEHRVRSNNISNGSVENLTVNLYDRADDGSLRVDFNANPELYGPEENALQLREYVQLLTELADTEPDQPVNRVGARPTAVAG